MTGKPSSLCAEDAERITRDILGTGVTVENQATEMRRRDLEKAHRIIDRHPIMHGMACRLRMLRRPGWRWRAILPTPSLQNEVGRPQREAELRTIVDILGTISIG
jgi:hypothetical protein